MKALRGIDKWWFGYGSPVTMGVVRMVTGFLALVNFLMLSLDFDAWFTERGFTPAWFAERWAGDAARLNLLAGVTDVRVTAAVFGLAVLASLLTMIGLATRVSSIVLFVLLVTLHHRTPDILHSGDTLLRQLAFIVMIAPSGAACSLDRLIGLWRGVAPAEPASVSLWPQRLLQLQVAVVYLTTAWHKLIGTTWRDGTATWYPPHLNEFDRFPVPAFLDQQPVVAMTTYGTLIVEVALGTLVFSKVFRKWALLGGVLLHAFIEYRFNIPLFSWIMVSTYLAFYKGEEVSAWALRVGAKLGRWRLHAVCPSRVSGSPRLQALRATDAFGLVAFVPGNVDGWAVSTGQPEASRRAAPARLLSRCVGAWPMWLVYPLWPRLLASVIGDVPSDPTSGVKPQQEKIEAKAQGRPSVR